MKTQQTAETLRNMGIAQAVNHADERENWSSTAYAFLLNYINRNDKFMVEDVRYASTGIIQEPPSNRAWGAVVLKAYRNKIIKHCGYGRTNNPLAHKTPASVWSKNN